MRYVLAILLMLVVTAFSSPVSYSSEKNWIQSDMVGSVMTEVQLMNPETFADDRFVQFRIYLNTHSGDLTQIDFSKLISVEVDGHPMPKPVTWTWERKSSHHPVLRVTADLTGTTGGYQKLGLIMRTLDEFQERPFEWTFDPAAPQGPRSKELGYYVFIPNAADGTITVIDGASLQTIDTIEVGNTASHGIAVSRDGKYIYSGDMEAGRVVTIDANTRQLVSTLDAAGTAHGIDISPNGWYVFVTGDKLTVIDTRTNTITAVIGEGLGESPSHVEFHPNGRYAYLTDPESDTLTVISIPDFTVEASIIVGDGPNESSISPDGERLYVANWEANEVAVVDTRSLTVVDRFPAGAGTHGVVVSPDGKQIWTANRLTNDVRVLDARDGTLIAAVLSGEYTNHLAFSPDGDRVFVTNARDNEVVVVDRWSFQVIKRMKTGQEPHELDYGGWRSQDAIQLDFKHN